MMGCKVLLFLGVSLLCSVFFGYVRAQCPAPSFPSNYVVSSESSTSFADKSTVTFQCMIGHVPVNSRASKTVTCEGNVWSKLELTCTRKSCGSPPDFANGKYNLTGILFGDTITPVCNKGYVLAGFGSQQRVCRDQGWDGRDPYCEVVKCAAPPNIANGRLEDEPLDSYDYLNAVTYICDNGLSLIGTATLYCSEDGTFKPEPPICMDGCPKPEVPNAIRIGGRSPPYKIGNFIDYKCDDGYTMKGESHIVCRGNGWDPNPPECIEDPKPCGVPAFGGNVVLTDTSQKTFPHGSTVTFQCRPGYEPVDSTVSKSVTCNKSKWSQLLLTCKAIPTTTPATTTPTTTKPLTIRTTPKGPPDDKGKEPGPPSDSLSGGAIAGICLAVIGVVGGIIGLIVYKKNQSKRQYSDKVATGPDEL